MKQVKLVNGALWGFNVLLGAGIVVFAFNFLLFPKNKDLLAGVEPVDPNVSTGTGAKTSASLANILNLPNPIVKPTAGPNPTGPSRLSAVKLIGTMPCKERPSDGAAILTIGNKSVMAEVGQPIEDGGVPVAELHGWRLVEVFSSQAVLTNGAQTETLRLEELTVGPAAPGDGKRKTGDASFENRNFSKSKLISSNDSRQQWEIDQEEIAWIMEHFDEALQRDFDIRVNAGAGGGIVIDAVKSGSVGAMRGLQSGDIVRSVNGIELKSLEEVQKLKDNKSFKQSRGATLTVERGGRTVVFEYTPAK